MLWPDDFPEMRMPKRHSGDKPTILKHDHLEGLFARHDGTLYQLGKDERGKRQATIVTDPKVIGMFKVEGL
jgi:hypothetical protein